MTNLSSHGFCFFNWHADPSALSGARLARPASPRAGWLLLAVAAIPGCSSEVRDDSSSDVPLLTGEQTASDEPIVAPWYACDETVDASQPCLERADGERWAVGATIVSRSSYLEEANVVVISADGCPGHGDLPEVDLGDVFQELCAELAAQATRSAADLIDPINLSPRRTFSGTDNIALRDDGLPKVGVVQGVASWTCIYYDYDAWAGVRVEQDFDFDNEGTMTFEVSEDDHAVVAFNSELGSGRLIARYCEE